MQLTSEQRIVRRNLVEYARQERTVTYGEVASWVGTPAIMVGATILDPINEVECSRGKSSTECHSG